MNSREGVRGVSQSKDVRMQDTDKDGGPMHAQEQKGTHNFSQ